MSSDSHPDPEAARARVLLAARLTPHRSLSRGGFIALMSFVGGISFIAGLVFWWMGAWPVFGFFGLDVLVIWWAFRVNFRRARATEDVTVSYDEIHVRRTSHRGHSLEWRFNPLWVQIERKTHEEFGLERLYLVHRGRRISLAGFLGPDEKERFAKVLAGALQEARRGPTYNPVS
jgi:uncharacterized membrane protein